MAQVSPTLSLLLLGSSLTTGRLAGPDSSWVPTLLHDLPNQPEAKGPIKIINAGKGSQTSAWGITQTPILSTYRATHVLMEGFAINDCVDFGAGPVIDRATHNANLIQMITDFRSGNAGIDITVQSMSPVSAAGAAVRPQLATYYADEIATAAAQSAGHLDNYAAWPHPLPDLLSNGAAVGATAWGGTWNPADKTGNVTLSGGNLNATNTFAGNGGVRGTISENAGKWYFDQVINAQVGLSLGIMTAAAGLGNAVGSVANSYGFGADGSVYAAAATPVGNVGPFANGDTMQIYADFTNLRLYIGRNGVWLNGDPVKVIGGLPFAAGTYFPALGNVPGDNSTANFATVYPGDGLHPLWTGGLDTYLYPAVLALMRAKMAAFWP